MSTLYDIVNILPLPLLAVIAAKNPDLFEDSDAARQAIVDYLKNASKMGNLDAKYQYFGSSSFKSWILIKYSSFFGSPKNKEYISSNSY